MEKTVENVLEIFKDYIASSPFIDVCRTKFGYVLLHYSPERDEIMYTPEIIHTGDEMLQTLREEIILDVSQIDSRFGKLGLKRRVGRD